MSFFNDPYMDRIASWAYDVGFGKGYKEGVKDSAVVFAEKDKELEKLARTVRRYRKRYGRL